MSVHEDLHAAITSVVRDGIDIDEDWHVTDYVVVAVAQSMKPGEADYTAMSYLVPPGQPYYRTLGLLAHATRKHEHDITTHGED